MRRTSNRPGPRPGFTLVELLVVMTIIAILTALAAAAVVRAMIKMDETKTRNEISQLQGAIQAFKTDFNVPYIPDTLYLPPGADPTGQSAQYMTSVWTRLNSATDRISNTPANRTYWGTGNSAVKLQGYQTIVFFLGGAQDPSGSGARIGFSTNPADPMSTTGPLGATNRKGPYFEFPTNRLAVLSSDSSKGNMFPAFIDVYGTMPYVYFSASKAGNDYGSTYAYNSATYPQSTQNGTLPTGTFFSVVPFQISSSRFANANGFQIIAAGRDGLFHDAGSMSYAGGLLWPGGGGSTDMGGYDNMTNFHPTLLGVPAN
jgi:prepilin-type N-terminal cleavage/methylation domain-containing protein